MAWQFTEGLGDASVLPWDGCLWCMYALTRLIQFFESFRMSFDASAFRQALGCFATGITVVTTKSATGGYVGVTVNSFNSVSLEPPLVLFSLDRTGGALRTFEASEHFVVNVLSGEQQALSNRFASKENGSWDDLAYTVWDAGCPVLEGGLAAFECAMETTYDGGDHVIILGRVLRIESGDAGSPLLYFRGKYAGLKDS